TLSIPSAHCAFTFTFHPIGYLLYHHSFPTRRSSDLTGAIFGPIVVGPMMSIAGSAFFFAWLAFGHLGIGLFALYRMRVKPSQPRSEEHTSELQSRENLVCRLLREQKKEMNTEINMTT